MGREGGARNARGLVWYGRQGLGRNLSVFLLQRMKTYRSQPTNPYPDFAISIQPAEEP